MNLRYLAMKAIGGTFIHIALFEVSVHRVCFAFDVTSRQTRCFRRLAVSRFTHRVFVRKKWMGFSRKPAKEKP